MLLNSVSPTQGRHFARVIHNDVNWEPLHSEGPGDSDWTEFFREWGSGSLGQASAGALVVMLMVLTVSIGLMLERALTHAMSVWFPF